MIYRKIRPVPYDDDIDLMITQLVEQNKVFESEKNESLWQATLAQLYEADSRLEYMTLRMLKKRVNFLMEKYEANCDDM